MKHLKSLIPLYRLWVNIVTPEEYELPPYVAEGAYTTRRAGIDARASLVADVMDQFECSKTRARHMLSTVTVEHFIELIEPD